MRCPTQRQGAPKHHSPQSHSFAHSVIPEPHNVIPAKQAVSKPLSLWERVAEGRCDPSQIQPLSLWERVAEGRCDPSQTQPLSLWERVAEGRVRAPQ